MFTWRKLIHGYLQNIIPKRQCSIIWRHRDQWLNGIPRLLPHTILVFILIFQIILYNVTVKLWKTRHLVHISLHDCLQTFHTSYVWMTSKPKDVIYHTSKRSGKLSVLVENVWRRSDIYYFSLFSIIPGLYWMVLNVIHQLYYCCAGCGWISIRFDGWMRSFSVHYRPA